jgi:hypothetical protein
VHPKGRPGICRYGADCPRIRTCTFLHPKPKASKALVSYSPAMPNLKALSLGGTPGAFVIGGGTNVRYMTQTVRMVKGGSVARPAAQKPQPGRHEVMLSFDTTGSMYTYLESVRSSLAGMIDHLFATVPGIHVGVIAHGDYCDKDSSYVIKFLPLSRDKNKLLKFVKTVGRTNGGDAPECYELALSKAAFSAGWHTSAITRALVLVGDAPPHEPGYECNGYTNSIDWRKMLSELAKRKVQVFSVQCGGSSSAAPFYKTCAKSTHGSHLHLRNDADGIDSLKDVISTVCLRHDKRALKAHVAAVRRRCSERTSAVLQQIIQTTVVTVTGSSSAWP